MNEHEVIHTTLTDQLAIAQEESHDYLLALKVTWFCVGVAIVGYAMLIIVGFKFDPVVRVGCPQYQEIPLPIITPLPK